MAGQMNIDGPGMNSHGVLKNQVIGGGYIASGVQGSFKPRIKPKVAPKQMHSPTA